MKLIKLLFMLFCSALLLCGCGMNSPVVSVGDAKITRKEFNLAFLEYKKFIFMNIRTKFLKNENNKYAYYKLRQRNAYYMIKALVLEDEYKTKNIKPTQEDLDRSKNRLIKFFGSEEKLLYGGTDKKLSEDEVKTLIYNSAKEEMLLRQAGMFKVSSSEIAEYYKKNIYNYKIPTSFEYSHILIKTNPSEIKKRLIEADKKNKIAPLEMDRLIREEANKNKKILKEVEGKVTKENFSQMAKKYSQDKKTASNGGYAGWVKEQDLTEIFVTHANKQMLDTISEPINTALGTQIIYLKDRKPAHTISLDEAKGDIELIVLHNKIPLLLDEYIEKVKSSKKIKYHDRTLNPDYIPLSIRVTNLFSKNKSDKKGK
ncbi:peptidylprolyl isomerase [bacterium]|nr:peptidylprolyl isomerase [bacterium]